jgi:periplasmic divalent cation tolerance protein
MEDFVIIFVTAGSAVEAEHLARTLVEERLAACVNRIRSVKSIYRWQGKVEESEEELLIIKSRNELFASVEKRVSELHSYAVPEVVAVPIIKGSQAYLQWLGEQLAYGAV